MESFGLVRPSEAPAPTLSEAMAENNSTVVSRGSEDTASVTCPGCESQYGVPPGLLPPWGGRIRCPRCTQVFAAGALAEAEEVIESLRARDPEGWKRACGDGSLWGSWGSSLLGGYQTLRDHFGPALASRAYRRALESAAPGVPWLAPPTAPNPLEPLPDPKMETMFERRREG